MQVDIWSDIACPWCYVGKRRFERALGTFPGAADVEVTFRPYQLDPAAPVPGVPLLPTLARKFGPGFRRMTEHVARVGREEGLAFDWERAIAANTFPAHRLLRLAGLEGGRAIQHELADRLFEAHFARGLDVSDPDCLTTLATGAGLDRARVTAYLASDEGTHEARAEIAEARELGITAVPAFVFAERRMVSGAQPSELFAKALAQVAREAAGKA